jgi:predicted ATPase/DNA-binding SARP family transcriptional activator
VIDRPAVSVRLLGAFEVNVDGRAVGAGAWRLRKAADLVKLLAIAPGYRLHREQLMESLWPDKEPDAAANNLYQAIHGARRALGPAVVEFRDGIVSLAPGNGGGIDVDVTAFAAAIERADAGDVAAREEARALYRGELLPDDRFEDWAVGLRDALAAANRRNLSELAVIREREGDLEAALDCLRALLALDPTDEASGRRAMRLEARAGRRGAAQQHYESLRDALRRELDVEPDEETKQLERDIVEGRLDPLGEQPSTTNLPVQFTSFVGRGREVGEVQRLLAGTRLLTLTGTGGTGKTRLALEAAHAARGRYPDGVWLVELAAVRRDGDVVRATAEVFGVREAPGTPLLEAVARQLGDRRALIVLDNCEHLIDACAAMVHRLEARCPDLHVLATSRQPLRAPGEVVFRVPSLAIANPDEPIDPAELMLVDSVRLFVDRALAADPTFAVTPENAGALARLCFRLDGLPLAIELAASRVAAIPVEVLLERIGERFELLVGGRRTALTRQQTLRATIDWSYELLTPEQQGVFRRLAVFAGRVSPGAAEAICAPLGIPGGRLLAVLGDLVDQSLLVLDAAMAPPRFRMLETVRDYGRGRLADEGESDAVETAFLRWAVELSAPAAPRRPGSDWLAAFRRLGPEIENLRAALERAVARDPATALELAHNLWPYWLWDGHFVEGRTWLEVALAANPGPTPLRVWALIGLGALLGRAGDTAEHARRGTEALEIARGLGDPVAVGWSLQNLGISHWAGDALALALEDFEAAALIGRDAFPAGQAAAEHALAAVRWTLGDRDEARRHIDEALALITALPDDAILPPAIDIAFEVVRPDPVLGIPWPVMEENATAFRDSDPAAAMGYVLAIRGTMGRVEGDEAAARRDFAAALEPFRQRGDARGEALIEVRLGTLERDDGKLDLAREHLRRALAIRREIGDARGVSMTQALLGDLELTAGNLDEAERLLDASLAAARRRADLWVTGAALSYRVRLALVRDQPDAARASLEEALDVARRSGRSRHVGWIELRLAALDRLEGRDPGGGIAAAAELLRRAGDELGTATASALAGQR